MAMRINRIIQEICFKTACLYGQHCPLPIGRWKTCMKILELGGIHPWNNPEAWAQITRNLGDREVMIEGLRFHCNWEQELGFILTRQYEPYLCRVAKTILRPGDTVLDVGANIGFFALLFAHCCGPSGTVYAYEPVRATYNKLTKNMQLNASVKKAKIIINRKALSDISHDIDITIPLVAWSSQLETGQSSLVRDYAGRRHATERVAAARLDDERLRGPVSFIKCDVEGGEMLFLKGGQETISKSKPIMVLEWNSGPGTYDSNEIYEFIRSFADYEFYEIFYGGLRKTTKKDLEGKSGSNIFCAIRDLHLDRFRKLI
ncbi:MAG: FkbM family methyltransferase [Elusimicrobiota bacterium]